MHDIPSGQAILPMPSSVPTQAPAVLLEIITTLHPPKAASKRRGAPQKVSWPHLWLGLLYGVLSGMNSYQAWWRLLCTQAIGPFAPLAKISDDALVKRLTQAGLAPLQQLFAALSQLLGQQLSALTTTPLAPFASAIVALDETTLEAVARHLKWWRQFPIGDSHLLAGKLAGRFNIRTQQWDFVQFRPQALHNCKYAVLTLLEGLSAGSLLLFDLGYLSYPWFDYLTQQGYWWVSRLSEQSHYQLLHTYYRHHEILDALVWLGSAHGSRAGYAARLVRFGDGKHIRCYLTNVLDPRLLPMADIARLYARRWDIELAFLTLKEHLGLHHWWSSKPVLFLQQMWAVLIIAQLLQALRLHAAVAAGVDPFDVSLPLLLHYVPRLIEQRQNPLPWLVTQGKRLGLIRPSTRLVILAPEVPLSQFVFPPPSLCLVRKARYVEYKPRPGRSKRAKRPADAVPTGRGSAKQSTRH